MAIIYDLATGTVLSENKGVTQVADPADGNCVTPALQTVSEAQDVEQVTPMDAYMVLLQRLLRDL